MKFFILLIALSIAIGVSHAEDGNGELAIVSVKNHPKVQKFLADKVAEKFTIQYQQIKLGGVCGFVGCQWRRLVSVIVTSQSANKPSVTILALVEGTVPTRGAQLKVTFVEIKNSEATNW